MAIRFLRNRATGVVFAYHEGMAKHPDVEEISAEEALQYLEAKLKQREEKDKARELVARMSSADAVVGRLRALAQGEVKDGAPTKKPRKKAATRDAAALDVPEVEE